MTRVTKHSNPSITFDYTPRFSGEVEEVEVLHSTADQEITFSTVPKDATDILEFNAVTIPMSKAKAVRNFLNDVLRDEEERSLAENNSLSINPYSPLKCGLCGKGI